MEQAFSVFINGLTGVFIGMALLYITMKLLAVLGRESADDKDPS